MVSEPILINPPAPSLVTAVGIGGIAVIVAIAWVALFSRGDRHRALVLSAIAFAVMSASALAAWSGQLSRLDRFPPPMLVIMASILAMAFAFGFSSIGRDGAEKISFAALIGLQSFRLPLELVMHHAGDLGIMPAELSFSGYNFDIVTGAGALVIFVLLKSGYSVALPVLWVWNLWGTYCLAAIAFIAITSSPILRLFGDDPKHVNTWVFYFPYVWLPVVLVTVAICGHIVICRKLISYHRASRNVEATTP